MYLGNMYVKLLDTQAALADDVPLRDLTMLGLFARFLHAPADGWILKTSLLRRVIDSSCDKVRQTKRDWNIWILKQEFAPNPNISFNLQSIPHEFRICCQHIFSSALPLNPWSRSGMADVSTRAPLFAPGTVWMFCTVAPSVHIYNNTTHIMYPLECTLKPDFISALCQYLVHLHLAQDDVSCTSALWIHLLCTKVAPHLRSNCSSADSVQRFWPLQSICVGYVYKSNSTLLMLQLVTHEKHFPTVMTNI